ncbi:piriformospora indica-insensitive protein 2-like [Aristolochia californica]|uniref:piriformospora indica-insensitive protein 2-like n=1 Tax=Aristolochia californica TaxID=171875 RepID=UPI0035E0B8F9
MRKFLFFHSLLFLFLVLPLSATTNVETSTSPMEKREQETLYSILRSFVGNWFNGSEVYPDPCGWTPIQGVSCDLFDGIWHVTTMVIGPVHDNSLQCARFAEISPYLFELKHLKSLSFFGCFHHPTSLQGLPWEKLARTLETLEFRSNPGLAGEIPAGFSSFRKLRSLVLLENNLTGELPVGLGNLTELEQLVLAGNRFTGQIPVSSGGLAKLLIIDFSRNSLSGSLPSTICGLTSLLKLDLSNNSFDGQLPTELGQLRNLTLLDLRNNRFSNGLPQSLQEMVSLEQMLLSNNPIGGNLMKLNWQNLENLIALDFSSMGLGGEIPASMAEMKKLRFLALNENHLSGNVPPNFSDMPCVNALYLNGNNLAGELEFSEEFYGKMGRYFTVWSNPDLCYDARVVAKEIAPAGVKDCQKQPPVSNAGLKREVTSEDAHLSCSSIGSCVISGSGSFELRWIIMVAEMVTVFFFVFAASEL